MIAPEQLAEQAEVLSGRIIDLVEAELKEGAIGEVVMILGTASLSALLSLVAVGGGTRDAAAQVVNTLMAPLLDDIFGPAG